MTFLLKQRIKRLVHPFKYGFWTICRINKFRLEMMWENWDSYAGDGDYGYMFSYTGNRKTTKQMRREYSHCIFNPFECDENGKVTDWSDLDCSRYFDDSEMEKVHNEIVQKWTDKLERGDK